MLTLLARKALRILVRRAFWDFPLKINAKKSKSELVTKLTQKLCNLLMIIWSNFLIAFMAFETTRITFTKTFRSLTVSLVLFTQ